MVRLYMNVSMYKLLSQMGKELYCTNLQIPPLAKGFPTAVENTSKRLGFEVG